MRPDTWYGQAMASDKEKFQAWLEKTSTDEIRETLPNFGGTKKSVALDELTARARVTARGIGILAALVLAVCAVITLNYLGQP